MKPTTKKHLCLEALENRQLLAGDVDVFAIGNVLHIRGDSADNGISITSTSEGVFEVAGLSHGGSATTINELPNQTFVQISQITIVMGDGNDALVITGMTLAGSITASLGDGDDILGLGDFQNSALVDSSVESALGPLEISTNFIVDTGEGNDTVVARDVTAKIFTLFTGIGDDAITFARQGASGDADHIPGVTVTTNLRIDAGHGTNEVSIDGLNAGTVSLSAGGAADEITVENSTIDKGLSIDADDGANEITLGNVQAKSLRIAAGMGNDVVSIHDVVIKKNLSLHDNYGNDQYQLNDVEAQSLGVSLGFGDDQLTLDQVTTSKSISIDAGNGADDVDLTNIICKSLSVSLGAGDDALTLDNVAASKKIKINAGQGADDVSLNLVSATALDLLLGHDDDALTLERVIISKKSKIDGGKGTNSYTDAGNNDLGVIKQKNFPVTG